MVQSSIPPLIEGPVKFRLTLSFPKISFKKRSIIKSNECLLLSFKWWGDDTEGETCYVSPDTLIMDEDKVNNYGQFSCELHFDVRCSALALKRYFDDMNGLEIVVTAKQNKSNAQRKVGSVILDDLSSLIVNIGEEVVSEYPITLVDSGIGGSVRVKAKLEETMSELDKENAAIYRNYNSKFVPDEMRIERIDRILYEIDKELQSGIMDIDEFQGSYETVSDHNATADSNIRTAPSTKDQKKNIIMNALGKKVLALTLRNVELKDSSSEISSVFCKVYTPDTSKSFTFAYGSDAMEDIEVLINEKWHDSDILLYFDFLDANGNTVAQGASYITNSLMHSGDLVIVDEDNVIATCSIETSLKRRSAKRNDKPPSKFTLHNIVLSNEKSFKELRIVIKGSKTTKTVFQHSSPVTVNLPCVIEVWDGKKVFIGLAEINEDKKDGSLIPLFNPLRSLDHNGTSIVINSKRDTSPTKKQETQLLKSMEPKNNTVKEVTFSPEKSLQGRGETRIEEIYLALNVECIRLSDSNEAPQHCEVIWQDCKMNFDLSKKEEQRFLVSKLEDFKSVENNQLLFHFHLRNIPSLHATIDLNPLCAGLIQINGWYRLKDDNNQSCGSVHIKVKPSQQLSTRKHGIALLTSGTCSERERNDELQILNEQLNRSLKKPSPIEKLQESFRRSIAKENTMLDEEQDGQLSLEDLEGTGQVTRNEITKEPAFGMLVSDPVLKYDVGWDFTKNITKSDKDEA